MAFKTFLTRIFRVYFLTDQKDSRWAQKFWLLPKGQISAQVRVAEPYQTVLKMAGCYLSRGRRISQSISTHFFLFSSQLATPQRENQLDYLLSTYVRASVCYFSSDWAPSPPFSSSKCLCFSFFLTRNKIVASKKHEKSPKLIERCKKNWKLRKETLWELIERVGAPPLK